MSFPRDHIDGFPGQMGQLWYCFHGYGDYKIKENQMHKIHEQKGLVVLCPHQLHEVFEIWPFLTLNWKHSPHLTREHFNYNKVQGVFNVMDYRFTSTFGCYFKLM
jgi:hypothetical protein